MSEYILLPFQTSFEEPLKNPPNRRESLLFLITLIIVYLFVSVFASKIGGKGWKRECGNILMYKTFQRCYALLCN